MNRNARPEHHLTEPGIDLMRRAEFVRAVRQAEADAADAARVRETLHMWADRLLPYLDRDPALTVAEALARFNAAHDLLP